MTDLARKFAEKIVPSNSVLFKDLKFGNVFEIIRVDGTILQFHLPGVDPTKFKYQKDGEDSAVILDENGKSTLETILFSPDIPVRRVE
jgi:hypothetical protein